MRPASGEAPSWRGREGPAHRPVEGSRQPATALAEPAEVRLVSLGVWCAYGGETAGLGGCRPPSL